MEKDTGKELWRVIYQRAGWIKSLSPTILGEDERILKKRLDIANTINNYYKEKIDTLISNIPGTNIEPLHWLKKRMVEWCGSECYQHKLKFKTVNREKIREILSKLSNSTATGLDGISIKLLKDGAEFLDIHLSRIINLSIITSAFPNKWRIGKVIPLFKEGDKNREDKTAYRPVCLLSGISKVLEKVISEQIITHMEENGMLHTCHFAFRKGLSTVDAMAVLYEEWMNAMERREQSVMISIDM